MRWSHSIPAWTYGLVLSCCVLSVDRAAAQTQFQLIVPGSPRLSSSALLTDRELVVTDSQGVSYRYSREPRLDAPDGQSIGFVNVVTQQAIRWPVLGQGPMILGDAQGLAWRPSQQQVQPVGIGVGPGIGATPGLGAGPVIRPGPVGPGAGGPIIVPQPGLGGVINPGVGLVAPQAALAGWTGGATDVASGVDRNGNAQLAMIDSTGIVRVYGGGQGGWNYVAEMAGLDIVGGASLCLTPDIVPGLPRVFTVTAGGALVMLTQGQGPLPFAPQVQFPRSAALSPVADPRNPASFAVDAAGRLWQLDLARQAHQLVDGTPGVLSPGSRVQVLSRPGALGRLEYSLFVTDARGTIVQYQAVGGGWAPRTELAYGFMPGSPVGAAVLNLPNGNALLYLAAVDWRGQLQLLSGSPAGLQAQVIDTGSLPPGANVLIQVGLEGPLLSAVGGDGVWRVWRPGVNNTWNVSTLYPGFSPGAPVIADPSTGGLVAVDVRGRLVPAAWQNGGWNGSIHHPSIPLPPKLVSRNVVPNNALPPARVTLVNGSPDEIVVQVADAAAPANSHEVRIPVGGAVPEVFERDAGGVIEEVYLVPDGLGGFAEQVDRYPVPAQPRYSLAVWANRTTYQFINKNPNKPAGAQPNFDLKSHVSLGVLSLPPGDLLRDGTTIDVAQEAARNRNPGAAGAFGLPSGGVEVVPR